MPLWIGLEVQVDFFKIAVGFLGSMLDDFQAYLPYLKYGHWKISGFLYDEYSFWFSFS